MIKVCGSDSGGLNVRDPYLVANSFGFPIEMRPAASFISRVHLRSIRSVVNLHARDILDHCQFLFSHISTLVVINCQWMNVPDDDFFQGITSGECIFVYMGIRWNDRFLKALAAGECG